MPESVKQLKSRIRCIDNTRKITRAMQMVSVAKLKRTENSLASAREYYRCLEGLLADLQAVHRGGERRYFRKDPGLPVELCVITSDSGLCGSYNAAVIRSAEEFISRPGNRRVRLSFIGRKGFSYFKKKGYDTSGGVSRVKSREFYACADEVSSSLAGRFLEGEAGAAHVAHMHYESLSRYRPVVTGLFPVEAAAGGRPSFILETEAERIAAELLPRFISAKMRLLLVESLIAEYGLRMMAMKSASDNAGELQSMLIQMRNKARQALVTREMIEIISASGAGQE